MIDKIASSLKAFFHGQGDYRETPPVGLCDPLFPSTFNPSAAHGIVRRCISPDFHGTYQSYILERCIRDVDLSRVPDGLHAIFFEMFAFVDARPEPELDPASIFSLSLELLRTCGFDPQCLLFSVFGGGHIKGQNIPADSVAPRVLRDIGIDDEHILCVRGPNNFLYLSTPGDAAGPRCEVLFDRGEGFYPRFIEIASIIFEGYYFKGGALRKSPNVVAGAAFGLERLALVLEKKPSIWQLAIFTPVRQALESIAGATISTVMPQDFGLVIEFAKAIVFILCDAPDAVTTPRAPVLKRFISRFRTGCARLGINHGSTFLALAEAFASCYHLRYPILSANVGRIVEVYREIGSNAQ